jgi:multidrug efflux pump subunit AcrB
MFNLASLARPYFGAIVLTAALLTAGGIYSATRMPSSVYPEVNFARIAVVAKVPGLSVPNQEVQVTRPLEQAVSTVLGVSSVRAKTIRGGTELSIDLNPGTDIPRALQLTWNRIGAIRSELPPEMELTVEQMTPSIFPMLSVVLTRDGSITASQLRDYAFYQLAPQIKNIPDVLYANTAGGDLREIEIEVRPDDLLAAGLSAADLADQISKVHRLQPVGRIERPPIAFNVIVNTQAESAKQLEDLIISTKNNQPLRVRDVADVRVYHQDRVQSIGFEGKDAVVITVFRRLGGNTVNISNNVRQLLATHPPPRSIKATMAYDQATFVNTSVNNVRDAIIIGGLFSILILLAFLRSWRATLISALAIPTTLAITFLFLHWSGETLNLMSLGGLAVAIGLIIDDTVVVIENIARHLEAGKARGPEPVSANGPPAKPKIEPIDAASREITGAVVGSTLTTVLVFVPLAFIVGVYGQFFASLSISLSIAVLLSMVISLTLVPVFAAKFLAGKPMPAPGIIYRALAHVYELGLSVVLRFPAVTFILAPVAACVAIALLLIGVPAMDVQWKWKIIPTHAQLKPQEPGKPPPAPLFPPVNTGLLPLMDEGSFILDYRTPSGTPLSRTEEMVREIESILSENPDIDAYVRRTGSENGIFATESNRGDIQVVLRPAEENPWKVLRIPERLEFSKIEDQMKELGKQRAQQKYGPKFTEAQMTAEGKAAIREMYRRRPVVKIREEIEDEIREKFSEHQIKVETVAIMEDELNDMSGASKPVEIKIFGPEYPQLLKLADQVGDMLEKKGKGRGFKEVNSNVHEGNPDLMVRVDGVKATRLGLTADAVERQLRAIFFGQVATTVRESALRITDVRVRYPDRWRFGPDNFFDTERLLKQWILVPEPSGSPAGTVPAAWSPLAGPTRAVPLGAVATVVPSRTPDEQWRENQRPVIYVHSDVDQTEAGLNAVVADINQWMPGIPMPSGYRWELGGHFLRQQEAFRSLGIVMIVAILLVFIMLAFQFHSVVLPLLIFFTQPLSFVAGLFALWLTGTPLNVSSYMGAILLVGLDMKNGILLVEYIQQLRKEGMELRQALLLAGRTRFRPILMTSLAAILGLLPLALGIGPGAQMQQPLAIMVIGGLTANMLFTRMVIPAGYLLYEDWRQRWSGKAAKEGQVPQERVKVPVHVAG